MRSMINNTAKEKLMQEAQNTLKHTTMEMMTQVDKFLREKYTQ